MNIITQTKNPFDQIRNIDEQGNEYWLARQLQTLLGYKQWRRFEETIERAKVACANVGSLIEDHFTAKVGNLVERPQGGGNSQSDYRLSRYACYLTAMNGDPRKVEIAAAQTYFVIKTHEAELAPQVVNRITELEQKLEGALEAIAAIQSSETLSAIPPGWDAKVWASLPSQDQRHFRHLWRRRKFRPSNQGGHALPASSEEMKKRQRDEVAQVIGQVSEEEKQRMEEIKKDMLAKFWGIGGEQ